MDLKDFEIGIGRLSEKGHTYHYQLGDTFFKLFPESLIDTGKLEVLVELEKSVTMLQLSFDIQGHIELVCDRSLEPFDYPLNFQEHLILKFGDHHEELTDEIELIERDTQEINIGRYLYEFIGLAVPMKKIHPKYEGQTFEETEEGMLVYSSQLSQGEAPEEESTDPRWEILKKLKDN
jgi:uncharacterized protein